MKRAPKFKLPLSKALKELLIKGRHLELFTHNHGRILQKVDFHHQVVTDGYNTGTYKIMLSAKICPDNEIACVLPNHPDPEKQVMFVHDYWSLENFNTDLNKRLQESLPISDGIGTARLAVCFGSHAFLCQGIQGTAYIVWASHISYTNRSNVAAVLTKNMPLIINKNGWQQYKGIFLLKAVVQDADGELSRIPITEHTPNMITPIAANIFVAESRKPHDPKTKIQTMSANQALIYLTTQDDTTTSVSRESNPFEASLDFEESAFGGIMPDGGSPRQQLFMQELPMDPRRLQHTPPIAFSDSERPDPFEEEEEKGKKNKHII